MLVNMKSLSSIAILVALSGMSLSLSSCKNDENFDLDSDPLSVDTRFSITGRWYISEIDYLFDGKKLDYHEGRIGYRTTADGPVRYYSVQGVFMFNDDGTGTVTGMGENESDSFAINYDEKDGVYSITSEYNKNIALKMQLDGERLYYSFLLPDVYGWSTSQDSHTIRDADGKGGHKIEVVTYMTRAK